MNLSSGAVRFDVWENSTGNPSITSSGSINNNIWHHLVGTYDGSTVKLYIDGTSAGSTAEAGTGVIYYQPGGIAIGRDGDNPGKYFSGLIQDVRIYNRALSDSEINTLYKLTGGSLTAKDQMTSTTLYTKGVFKEVYN